MKRHCLLCAVEEFLAEVIELRLIVSHGVCRRSLCNNPTSVIAHHEDTVILLPSNGGFAPQALRATHWPKCCAPRQPRTLIKEAVNVFHALLTSCTLCLRTPRVYRSSTRSPYPYLPATRCTPFERLVWTRRCSRKRSHVR